VSVAAPHTSFSVIAVCAIALWFFGSAPGPSAQEKEVPEGHASGHAGAVGIQMRNVNFRLTDGIVLELWLSLAKKRLVVRRSLLTGQPLSRELARTPSISTLEVQLHPQLNNTRRASRRDGPEGAVRVQAIGAWREAENFRIQKEKLPRRWPALCRIGKTFSPDSRF
jgi:hypothetical protein